MAARASAPYLLWTSALQVLALKRRQLEANAARAQRLAEERATLEANAADTADAVDAS